VASRLGRACPYIFSGREHVRGHMPERERARSVNPGPELTLQLPLARTSARQLRVALAELLAARKVPRSATRDRAAGRPTKRFVNAFMHGGNVEGTVSVRADVQDNRVSVTICDDGCGFEYRLPRRALPARSSERSRPRAVSHPSLDGRCRGALACRGPGRRGSRRRESGRRESGRRWPGRRPGRRGPGHSGTDGEGLLAAARSSERKGREGSPLPPESVLLVSRVPSGLLSPHSAVALTMLDQGE